MDALGHLGLSLSVDLHLRNPTLFYHYAMFYFSTSLRVAFKSFQNVTWTNKLPSTYVQEFL